MPDTTNTTDTAQSSTTDSREMKPAATRSKPATKTRKATSTANGSGDFVLPLVHVSVPSTVVNVGFWGGLAGAVALGVIDPPVGVLLGAGVVIAHHHRRSETT